jgi:hypothetical protein
MFNCGFRETIILGDYPAGGICGWVLLVGINAQGLIHYVSKLLIFPVESLHLLEGSPSPGIPLRSKNAPGVL